MLPFSMTGFVRGSLACVATAFAFGCGSSQAQPGSASAGLAVAWQLDNTSTIGGYTVGMMGAPAVTTTPLGPALCFGGKADGLAFPVNPLDMQYEFTIQALIKPDPDGATKQQFLHVQDKAEARAILELRLVPGGSKFYMHSFARSGTEQQELENEAAQHPTSEWHWTALTYASGTVKHYVDGGEEASAPLEFVPMKKGEMAVGTRLNGENWFKGCVRELRFANTALAPEQLASKPGK